MSVQDVILGQRVAHIRELKTEIERLKAENSELQNQARALASHFAFALLAAQDLAESRLEMWDGWNLILGSEKVASDRPSLIALAREKLAADPSLKIWIVFDGHDERVAIAEERLRVSYTGGTGLHRADRFILDFARMAAYRGLSSALTVRTNDKDFLKRLAKLNA